ncbi:hypothetical protein predicted by Glimmer/Critica [Corynebacterium glutamicum ATCC 13032]|nr:hypothetical protein predicted by Glimmer/Critica [Corynebacterium glutamicum ATCC 13032]
MRLDWRRRFKGLDFLKAGLGMGRAYLGAYKRFWEPLILRPVGQV